MSKQSLLSLSRSPTVGSVGQSLCSTVAPVKHVGPRLGRLQGIAVYITVYVETLDWGEALGSGWRAQN